MKIFGLFFLSIFCLYFTSCSNEQRNEKPTKKQPPVFAYNFITTIDLKSSSSDLIPICAFIGDIKPPKETIIWKVNVIDKDSAINFYFDQDMFGTTEDRYIKLSFYLEKDEIDISSSIKKEIPSKSDSLEIFRNDIEERQNLEAYPYYFNWKLSGGFSIQCVTFQGCIDTDRAELKFLKNRTTLFSLSNLGWISLIKYDINKNKMDDVLIVSNKMCENRLDFYLVLF
jgi:hypothetical protein